jgi:hypothetical protein
VRRVCVKWGENKEESSVGGEMGYKGLCATGSRVATHEFHPTSSMEDKHVLVNLKGTWVACRHHNIVALV